MIRRSGVKVAMLTGDRKETAVAIAKELNIFSANNLAVSDDELLRMSEEELAKQIDDITVFYDPSSVLFFSLLTRFLNE
jgi:Ca2+-transporting ATPase